MINNHPFIQRSIRWALEEDLGHGDLTTETIITSGAKGEASLIAREDLVLAGLPVFKMVFEELYSFIQFEEYFKEGDIVPAGTIVCLLKGPLDIILIGERTALNFLQRMSGIATLSRQYVDSVAHLETRILDTRKTAPGLRWFDKYAVQAGGGRNHRFGLSDGILIKDNHLAAAGSITRAVQLAKKGAPHTLKVEVEVEDLAGVQEALDAGADIILLDNMDLEDMKKAVALTNGRAQLEASGGITLDTVVKVAETGIDMISIGALTHSAIAADFSLEITTNNG